MSPLSYPEEDDARQRMFPSCRVIQAAIKKLSLRHDTHIKVYGKDNERRLTGRHETASVCSLLLCRILATNRFII